MKATKQLGVGVLLIAVVLGGLFLPALYPARDSSAASATLHRTIQHLAFAHLFAGVLGGFGLALLVWPFRRADS